MSVPLLKRGRQGVSPAWPAAYTHRMLDQLHAEGRAVVAALVTLPIVFASLGPAAANVVLVPQTQDSYDTLLDAATQIDGAAASSRLGVGIVTGDFSCDGVTDIAMASGGGVQVLHGPIESLPRAVDLATPVDGFLIEDSISSVVDAAGDVNGDGCDDLLVPFGASATYVVFGRAGNDPVRLSALGAGGYRVVSSSFSSRNTDAEGIGDVNRDGLGDIVLSDANADSAYVVFGQTGSSDVLLSSLGSRGYPIAVEGVESVSDAGDVNRDGLPDLLLGASRFDGREGPDAGAVWVVFGKANTTPMDVTSLGAAGYRIEGGEETQYIGVGVVNAGDVNADGVPDQLIGRLSVAEQRGGVMVVFGKSSSTKTVRLKPSGFRGYVITGTVDSQIGRHALVGNFDANRDGRADQIIGAPYSDASGRTAAGSVWVVYGQGAKRDISLDSYTDGYRVDGPATDAQLGRGAAAIPLGGGQGVRVLSGAMNNSANGRFESGSVFLIGPQSSLPSLQQPVTGLRYETVNASSVVTSAVAAARVRPQLLRIQATFASGVVAKVVVGRIVAGRFVVTAAGVCRAGKPRRPALACTRIQPVFARTVVVAGPGRRTATLPKALKRGRYVVRLWATTAEGRTFGPYTATVAVPR